MFSRKKTTAVGVAGPNHEATAVRGVYRRKTSPCDVMLADTDWSWLAEPAADKAEEADWSWLAEQAPGVEPQAENTAAEAPIHFGDVILSQRHQSASKE
jgi:hypothetical protein